MEQPDIILKSAPRQGGSSGRPFVTLSYAQSHLLAGPSSYEGLGIAYLEGMRFVLPAIATTAGAAHAVISHDRDGFLVPPKDVAALARYLGIFIKDRRRLLKMSLAAQESAAGHPTWAEGVARIHRFLHGLLRQRTADH
jgi:glycosyltransferase involved in cell wall biosynthesis